jgi:hypothetical protein
MINGWWKESRVVITFVRVGKRTFGPTILLAITINLQRLFVLR